MFALLTFLMSASAVFGLNLEIGAKGGPGLGWLSGSGYEEYRPGKDNEARVILSAGVFIDIQILSWLSVQPEALISMKGGAYNDSHRFRATFLEIPLYIKPKVLVGKGELYFLLGPYWAFLLSDFHWGYGGGDGYDYTPEDSTFLGVAGGIGYSFPTGKGTIILESLYSRTLDPLTSSLYLEDGEWVDTIYDTYFHGVVLYIGYSIPIGKK